MFIMFTGSSPLLHSAQWGRHNTFYYHDEMYERKDWLILFVYNTIRKSKFLIPPLTFVGNLQCAILNIVSYPGFMWKTEALCRIPVIGNIQDNYIVCWCKVTGSSVWRTGFYSVALKQLLWDWSQEYLKRKCCSLSIWLKSYILISSRQ